MHRKIIAEPLVVNGLLPVLTLIGVTFAGLMVTGEGGNLREILGDADPFKALIWGSLSGLVLAIILSVVTGRLNLLESVHAMEKGLQPMLLAVIILTFAWAIADINDDLHTAGLYHLPAGRGYCIRMDSCHGIYAGGRHFICNRYKLGNNGDSDSAGGTIDAECSGTEWCC